MRFLFAADLHFYNHQWRGGAVESGLNRRAREQLDVLAELVRVANQSRAHLVLAGDVFDRVRPEPQLIDAVRAGLERAVEGCSVVVGNHDMVSAAPGDHALRPLRSQDVDIIEQPRVLRFGHEEAVLLCLPFRPGKAVEYLPGEVRDLSKMANSSGARLLVLHVGIWDDETPSYLRGADDAIGLTQLVQLCQQNDVQAVLAGNWHQHRHWFSKGVTVTQIGTAVPHNFSDAGPDVGCAVLYDTSDSSARRIDIPGPRFVTICWDDDLSTCPLDLRQVAKPHHYYRLVCPPDQVAAQAALLVELQTSGLLAGGEAVPNAEAVRAATQRAATAARAGSTVEQSLERYCGERRWDGLDGQAVLQSVRQLMKEAVE